MTPGDVYGGHKILVNKFVYDARPPRRYEVIVFKFPKEPWRNYIKRLVGLPGETIQVRNGDIYADGQLARKPDDVQDAVWIPVHDAAFVPKQAKKAWKPLNEGTEPPQVWRLDPHGAQANAHPELLEGERETWLTFTRGVLDQYGYNHDLGAGSNPVSDVRLRARVTAEEGAVVRFAVLEVTQQDRQEYERIVAGRFEFKAAGGSAGVEVDGKVQQSSPVALRPGQAYELALAYADDRARLMIDGATVLAWSDPFGGTAKTESVQVRLGAAVAPVTFERLRVDRDIYYVPVAGGSSNDPSRRPVVVPNDSYFAMGDNSPNSEDGRRWGFVHEGHLIGRAFLVFWPVVPFEVQFIR
jgi:signal peptidase I